MTQEYLRQNQITEFYPDRKLQSAVQEQDILVMKMASPRIVAGDDAASNRGEQSDALQMHRAEGSDAELIDRFDIRELNERPLWIPGRGLQLPSLAQDDIAPLEFPPPPLYEPLANVSDTPQDNRDSSKRALLSQNIDITSSFNGYEDGMRKHLDVDNQNPPTISLWSILKSTISQDFSNITVPISFNEPLSELQRQAEDLEYADLLHLAAELKDSAKRMVYVAAFACSKYASASGVYTKPFNPLLEETFEYVNPEKRYRFLAEQISHHPPISAVWAESQKWTYYGESALKTRLHGKSFDIEPEGTWFLKLRLASGVTEVYTWKKPTTVVTLGVIAGTPTVVRYDPIEIKNWTTGEVCVMDGWKMTPPYMFGGRVIDAQGKTWYRICGRWKDKIYAHSTPNSNSLIMNMKYDTAPQDSKSDLKEFVVWEANQRSDSMSTNLTLFLITLNDIPNKLRVYLPPTDTRLRPDQRAVENRQYEFAAAEKKRLEEKQRETQRNREAAGVEYVPRWFRRARCDVTGEEYWAFDGSYWIERASTSGQLWKGIEDIFSDYNQHDTTT